MKTKRAAIAADVILSILNCGLGWLLVILFGLTGNGSKFADPVQHKLYLGIGILHLAVCIVCSILLCKKERTRFGSRTGTLLLIVHILTSAFPYAYLAAVSFLG